MMHSNTTALGGQVVSIRDGGRIVILVVDENFTQMTGCDYLRLRPTNDVLLVQDLHQVETCPLPVLEPLFSPGESMRLRTRERSLEVAASLDAVHRRAPLQALRRRSSFAQFARLPNYRGTRPR